MAVLKSRWVFADLCAKSYLSKKSASLLKDLMEQECIFSFSCIFAFEVTEACTCHVQLAIGTLIINIFLQSGKVSDCRLMNPIINCYLLFFLDILMK